MSFVAFTIADESSVYDTFDLDNPSLPISRILSRLAGNGVLLALAPNDYTPDLYGLVLGLRDYINTQTSSFYENQLMVFESEGAIEDYIKDRDYDDDGYGEGKVAMAIVLNSADIDSKNWDYSIRTNFSYPYEQAQFPSVACLYGNPKDCDFTYTIPSTQYYTQDLLKPQDSSYLYGYTYSGFSTLQLLMDQYIFSVHGFNVNIMASIGECFHVIFFSRDLLMPVYPCCCPQALCPQRTTFLMTSST